MRRVLEAAACGLFFSCLPAQEAAQPQTDWAATVGKAQTHRRMRIRMAAANRVAKAGDPAIAAVRAYEKKHGRNAIRMDLVVAYTRAKSAGPATLGLLGDWAGDRDFFWRSQALEALANRKLAKFRPLFAARLEDPAYLTRIQAGRGLLLLDVQRDDVLGLLRDADPRVRPRIALALVDAGEDRGLPTLVEALRQDGAFLDYSWGARGAVTAFKKLRKVAGEDFGYAVGEPSQKNREAIAKFAAFAKQRLGDRWQDPVAAHRDDATYFGGATIRSCRNGDLFVRFGTARTIVFGLEANAKVRLPEAAWNELFRARVGDGVGVRGRVVCDYLRVMCKKPTPAVDEKFPPGSLPKKTSDWLLGLAGALEKNGRQDLARQIETRLPQFTVRRIP